MRIDTKDIVCTIAYLIGVRNDLLQISYGDSCSELIEQLENNQSATVIRYLCQLRTTLMRTFKNTDWSLRYDLTNIDKLEWFSKDDIKQLEKFGFQIILPNKRATDYTLHFNKLIAENINSCQDLFPDWLNWGYIKSLFIIPRFKDVEVQKREFSKFMAETDLYPYQQYIYWKPYDCGNMLYSDGKFLKILYSMNGGYFDDSSKYRTATEDIKNNIYSFIDSSRSVVVAVDCENSDVYKLYGMLKTLNRDEIMKINKIMLFDDTHTTDGWDYIEKFIKIPIEHIEVERIADNKSLVDMKVMAGVFKEFYTNEVTSFILLSSDSDYWALISSLPEADFLVIVEWNKCGQRIKDALEREGIYYCSLDDFSTGQIDDFKRAVLIGELKKYLPDLLSYNGKELVHMLYKQARIEADETEMKNFYNKFIRTITFQADSEGNFSLQVKV